MKKNRSIILAAGAFLLANLKWLVGLLKWSKFGGTFISMIISLAAYSWIYGWKFAAALVYLIFVHESGHLIAARQKGIRTTPAVFIPFVGAFISMKDHPRDAATEAYLAYGGPLAGLISFLPAIPLYYWTHDPFWALVVYLGATINLFNLLPVSPLDGGRIVSVLSTNVWLAGLLAAAALLYFSPSPILFLIFLLGLITWWNRAREGYQRRVLTYERDQLIRFVDELMAWPSLTSTYELREQLSRTLDALAKKTKKKRFFIPFLQDEKRFAQDKAQIDYQFTLHKRELLAEWERTPVLYVDGNPDLPAPSPVLMDAVNRAEARRKEVEQHLHRLATYYEARPSTRWKVLAAYLGLALVLSLFWYLANTIMQQHHGVF